MDEEHRTPRVVVTEPVTASEEVVTESVTASEEVVTGSVTASEEVVTGSVTSERPDTKVIRLNVTDIERIMASGYVDEKPAMIVHRLLEEVNELRQVKSDHASDSRQIEVLCANITELEEELEDLRSGSPTAVVPGQTTFSLKDAIASLKDVCDDDAVCIKFAAKVVEEQAKAMSKHLDREHSAEQKRLDREEREKDRALKKDLAESRAVHDKDMTMIKKGMVKQSDLDNVVFLGQKSTTPADRINNAKELAARQASHEEEEFGDVDPPGGDPTNV